MKYHAKVKSTGSNQGLVDTILWLTVVVAAAIVNSSLDSKMIIISLKSCLNGLSLKL